MLSTCADTTLIGRRTNHVFSRRREHRPGLVVWSVSWVGWLAKVCRQFDSVWSHYRDERREKKHTHKSYITATKSSGGSRGGARGARPPPPLFLYQPEARRAEKKFFWRPGLPFSKGLDDRGPPYLKV